MWEPLEIFWQHRQLAENTQENTEKQIKVASSSSKFSTL